MDSDAAGFRIPSLPVAFTWDIPPAGSVSPGHEGDRGEEATRSQKTGDANWNYKKVFPGRRSDIWSAVEHDSVTNQTTIIVPPCVAGTAVGGKLAMRLLHNAWGFHRKTDVDPAWSKPTPPIN